MEKNGGAVGSHRPLMIILVVVLCFWGAVNVEGYNNYTVGDSLGWYHTLENPNVDYQKWVDAINNFTLADFLMNNNQSVIQTYNSTTYNRCNYEDALDNNTIQWSSKNPSSTGVYPVTVWVPLLKIGETYFLSGDYDGEQCQNGQHFKINVTYGQGLPPSLRTPSDDGSPGPGPISPESGDNESVPDISIPPNYKFDHPNKDSTSDAGAVPSSSVSLFEFSKLFGVQLYGFLILGGLICYFC